MFGSSAIAVMAPLSQPFSTYPVAPYSDNLKSLGIEREKCTMQVHSSFRYLQQSGAGLVLFLHFMAFARIVWQRACKACDEKCCSKSMLAQFGKRIGMKNLAVL